jgi:hypothetical protein
MGRVSTRIGSALANTAILLVVMVVGLVLLEYASRILYPLSAGTDFYDADGNRVEIYRSAVTLTPNLSFFQDSPDFHALSSIGPLGLRAPEPLSPPEIIFLGDSFTFGQGLADHQTFPAIYCAEATKNCANLGYPGTGTYRQVAILEYWLGEVGWRPAQVNLFVFAMASSLSAGNDLFDTAIEIRAASKDQNVPVSPPTVDVDAKDGGVLQWVLSNRQWFRVNSNLVRILVVQFGPILRSWFSLESSSADLDGGIQTLQGQFSRLDALSAEYEFSYAIYLLHPMQDLIRQTHDETTAAIQAAAPASITVIDTAHALLENPAQFYFPFDGHFNPAGARAVANFLLDQNEQGRN